MWMRGMALAGRLIGLCGSSCCWPVLPPPSLSSGPERAKICECLLLKEKVAARCPALGLFTVSVVSLLLTSQEGSCSLGKFGQS